MVEQSGQWQALQQQLDLLLGQLRQLQLDGENAPHPDWPQWLVRLGSLVDNSANTSYQVFFENAKTPQLLINPDDGRIVMANSAAANFYGYSLATLQSMLITQINCLSPEQIHIEMDKAFAEQRCYFLFPHRLASGEVRQVEVHCGPVVIQQQPLLYSIIYDLTERLANEALLRQKRQRLQNILQGTQAGTWEWDLDTDDIQINDYWAWMLGYDYSALQPFTRQRLQQMMPAEDWLLLDARIRAHQSGVQPNVECELRFGHRLGHWVWVLWHGQLIDAGEPGGPRQMAGTQLDISARKAAELALRESELRYRALHDSLPVGCVMLDQRHTILAVNQEACRIFGMSPEEFVGSSLIGARWRRLRQDGQPMGLEEHPAHRCLASGLPIRDAIMGVQRGQELTIWLRINCQPLFHAEGQSPYAVVATLQDISTERRDEAALQLAASVFTAAREAILITDANGAIVQVNRAFCTLTGYSVEEVIGRNPSLLQSGYQDADFYRNFWHALQHEGHWGGEIWNRRKNGEIFVEQMTVSAVRNEQGVPQHYVCLASDISDKKQYQRQLEQQAYYDLLTGLPNRKRLYDQLTLRMAECDADPEQRLVLAYIDLDGFKQVNDQFGHAVGDQLLMIITKRMQITLREQDLLARIGGDEFICLIQGHGQMQDLRRMIKRLLRVIARPVMIEDLRVQVSASIGLASYPQHPPISGEGLIQQADTAMYRVKQRGKNSYLFLNDAE